MNHPSHKTRMSDASTFLEVCVYCGATDCLWDNRLEIPCPESEQPLEVPEPPPLPTPPPKRLIREGVDRTRQPENINRNYMESYEFNFWFNLSGLLPKKLLYFAFMKVFLYNTNGKYGNTVVPEITCMEAMKRFGDDHNI